MHRYQNHLTFMSRELFNTRAKWLVEKWTTIKCLSTIMTQSTRASSKFSELKHDFAWVQVLGWSSGSKYITYNRLSLLLCAQSWTVWQYNVREDLLVMYMYHHFVSCFTGTHANSSTFDTHSHVYRQHNKVLQIVDLASLRRVPGSRPNSTRETWL